MHCTNLKTQLVLRNPLVFLNRLRKRNIKSFCPCDLPDSCICPRPKHFLHLLHSHLQRNSSHFFQTRTFYTSSPSLSFQEAREETLEDFHSTKPFIPFSLYVGTGTLALWDWGLTQLRSQRQKSLKDKLLRISSPFKLFGKELRINKYLQDYSGSMQRNLPAFPYLLYNWFFTVLFFFRVFIRS